MVGSGSAGLYRARYRAAEGHAGDSAAYLDNDSKRREIANKKKMAAASPGAAPAGSRIETLSPRPGVAPRTRVNIRSRYHRG